MELELGTGRKDCAPQLWRSWRLDCVSRKLNVQGLLGVVQAPRALLHGWIDTITNGFGEGFYFPPFPLFSSHLTLLPCKHAPLKDVAPRGSLGSRY